MERAEVDRILSEQNFQQGARADASTAAKLGRLLGVDAIIIGSITQFQREDKNINLGLRKETKATVARSEEHTSELQSHSDLVCRLLLEKKKKKKRRTKHKIK